MALEIIQSEPRHVAAGAWTAQQIALLKRTVARELDDDEFALFAYQCRHRGLNPFVRQIHAVKRKSGVTFQTGIDGYRLIAERTGRYAGSNIPEWVGADGVWRDYWAGPGNPIAARVGVTSSSMSAPVWGVAMWDEYHQDGGGMWGKMPALMLAKCAEALALRKAFPEELAGIYTDDEMGQADNQRRAVPPAKSTGRPKATGSAPYSRETLERRYREIGDRADVLGIPFDSYDPAWSDAEVLNRGRELGGKVKEREAAIPTTVDPFETEPTTAA